MMINFIMVKFARLRIITIFKILFLLYKTNFVRPINKLDALKKLNAFDTVHLNELSKNK